MRRRGDIEGIAATSRSEERGVENGRDRTHVDLHSLQHAYVNNIWLRRKRGDRPPVVPEDVTNLGLLGQYVELERDIAFTFEYSTRTAWEAIYRLLKRGPAPPDVYQGQYYLKGVWAATKVFLGLTTT